MAMARQTRGSVDGDVDTVGADGLTGLHAKTLDRLGTAIAGGELPAGSVLYIDDLAEEHGVSRSVIREVLRVLSSMGLVASRRRMGTQILPPADWNVFDPQVIRWRLASHDRLGQLRSITELRTAVEPEAARLAAVRADRQEASALVALAAQMWAAGKDGDVQEFLRLDIDFHRNVLRCSGNEMFLKLNELVAAVLTGRTEHGLMPHHPDDEALQLHVDVAQGIQRRDGPAARAAMVRIMEQAMDEMSSLWPRSAEG
jgi:DNA-binding FadR family transcriptional regulator